jgi:hypothetical protein
MSASAGKNGNKRRKRRGAAANERVQAIVEQQVRGGQTSAAEIHRVLQKAFGGDANVPVLRTVQDMVTEARTNVPSEPWEFAAAEPDEIAQITPVWAVALENGTCLTRKDAEWIVRIRSAAPDLPPDDVWAIAGLYSMEVHPETQPLRDSLDAFLAFAPWRDVDHAERFYQAVNSGRIPSPAYSLLRRVKLLHGAPFGKRPQDRT